MSSNIDISFIIPIYNSEKFLKECIESILQIENQKYEIILIDDGSNDNSYDICKKYEKNDNISLFSQLNTGVSSARNVGIRNAKGRYISFIDSDDYIHLDSFEFLSTNKDLYCLGMTKVKEKFNSIIPFKKCNDLYKQFIKYPVYMNSLCNKFFKKSIIDKNGLFLDVNQKYREDMLFVISFLRKAISIEYIDYNYYYYRDNLSSASKKRVTKEIIENNVSSVDKIISIVGHYSKQFEDYLMISPVMPYLTDIDCYDYYAFKNHVKKPLIWKYSFDILKIVMSFLAALDLKYICSMVINIKKLIVGGKKQ